MTYVFNEKYEKRECGKENMIGKIQPQAVGIKLGKDRERYQKRIKNNCHLWS